MADLVLSEALWEGLAGFWSTACEEKGLGYIRCTLA